MQKRLQVGASKNFDLWPRRHLLLGLPKDVPASPHHTEASFLKISNWSGDMPLTTSSSCRRSCRSELSGPSVYDSRCCRLAARSTGTRAMYNDFKDCAVSAAKDAGAVIMEAWHKPRSVKHKGAVDLVRAAVTLMQ